MSDSVNLVASYDDGTAAGGGSLSPNDIAVSIQQVITNETFLLWVILAIVTPLFTSQAWRYTQELYAKYFTNPVRVIVVEVCAFVADILMGSALIYYIWTQRHPPPGEAASWYAAIYGLWFAAEGLKYFWNILFWEYGRESVGAICALLMGIVTVIVHIVLFILVAYRGSWAAFALILIASLIRLGALVCNGFFTMYVTRDTEASATYTLAGPTAQSMMTQRPVTPVTAQQRFQQQQQLQQQQQQQRSNYNANPMTSNSGVHARNIYPQQQQQQQRSR
jgi:hypothetical protein